MTLTRAHIFATPNLLAHSVAAAVSLRGDGAVARLAQVLFCDGSRRWRTVDAIR